MKTYGFFIDYHTVTIEVEAESKEEAIKKALIEIEDMPDAYGAQEFELNDMKLEDMT
jgi:hypothetical protein